MVKYSPAYIIVLLTFANVKLSSQMMRSTFPHMLRTFIFDSQRGPISETRSSGCRGSLNFYPYPGDEFSVSLNQLIHTGGDDQSDQRLGMREIRWPQNMDFSQKLFGKIDGNCCWSIFPKRMFQGKRRILMPGERAVLYNVPASAKVLKTCP